MAKKKTKRYRTRPLANELTYDVFICHSSHDLKTAVKLAKKLNDDGLNAWLDEWATSAKARPSSRTRYALTHARVLVLLMSKYTFQAEWIRLERQTALFRNADNKAKRFIPLLIDACTIDDTILHYAFIDWRDQAPSAYQQLVEACRAGSEAFESIGDTRAGGIRREPSIIRENEFSPTRIAILPEGITAVTGSLEKECLLWDLKARKLIDTMSGHKDIVTSVAVTEDGRLAVSGSSDHTLRVWDLTSRSCIGTLRGHSSDVTSVAITADGKRAASGSRDQTVRLWDLEQSTCVATLHEHSGPIDDISITPDGTSAISGSSDHTVCIWDCTRHLLAAKLVGHTGPVHAVAISADGERAVSGSSDRTVKVWDLRLSKCITTFEGHVSGVTAIAITSDGTRAVSGSSDNTVRAWEIRSRDCLAVFELNDEVCGLGLTGDERQAVAVSANTGTDVVLHILDLPDRVDAPLQPSLIIYTNAKVLIVGDTGVGKTGLAYRLAEDRFVSTISTDGVWVTQLRLPLESVESNSSDNEREIWLWDFAGQADYRLMHQLCMDVTALAVFVFNPQNEDPFESIASWDRDINRAASRPFRKLLVAGRCDRGGLMVSRTSIDEFCIEREFVKYLETSAVTGAGCRELCECISQNINWDDIPWTASPLIFKLLKDAIIQLKDEGKILLRIVELKQQIELRFPHYRFSVEDLRAVVGLLAGPGVVWQLVFGDYVLLQPERINQYAAALIRKVRRHSDEIGCIKEEEVLNAELDFQDMQRLQLADEQTVLRALHQTLISHGLCLREHTELGPLLIFPSYFKRERPELQSQPAVFVSYRFEGPLDEIYASLVVKLHHTSAFDKKALWRFAADFSTPEGKRVGLKMVKLGEGRAVMVVYFEPAIPDDTKVAFIRYVHNHLKGKDPKTVRVRHYVCPNCHTPVENRQVVAERLKRGLEDIVCVNCEERVILYDLIERKFASDDFQRRVREMEEHARTSIDNESRELILVGNTFAIAGEAGQIFRPVPNSDWGIDGEIEFKDAQGMASGRRVYVQLKSGDSYIHKRAKDGSEVFRIKNSRHASYWMQQAYPVMLVIRNSEGLIRWMNVTEYLRANTVAGKPQSKEIRFEGEHFTAKSVRKMRDASFRRPP